MASPGDNPTSEDEEQRLGWKGCLLLAVCLPFALIVRMCLGRLFSQ